MPKYVVFLIAANRSQSDTTKDDNEIQKDPVFKKIMQEFLNWMGTEMEADHVKGGDFLADSSDETNIRVEFHGPGTAPESEPEKNEDGTVIPAPKSSMSHKHQTSVTTNIMGYYTVEFPTMDEVIAWARSCPISYDGFALEIRQLLIQDMDRAVSEMPSESKEWAGDQILFARKKLFEEGKLKKEDDGNLWVKIEEDQGIKEIVAEAEKRETEKEQD